MAAKFNEDEASVEKDQSENCDGKINEGNQVSRQIIIIINLRLGCRRRHLMMVVLITVVINLKMHVIDHPYDEIFKADEYHTKSRGHQVSTPVQGGLKFVSWDAPTAYHLAAKFALMSRAGDLMPVFIARLDPFDETAMVDHACRSSALTKGLEI